MTDEAEYQPLPMPHGRVRPSASPLLVEEGRLPQELVEQARARHAEAEVLVLPREPEPHLQDEDPSLAIYNDSDMMALEVLRRGGVRADYLTEHRKVVSQFAAVEWIDFAVAVAEGVSAAGVIGIASYLVGRIRKARQSGSEPKLEVNLARPDGTLLHIRATDADAGVKALAETLAATVTDPAARESYCASRLAPIHLPRSPRPPPSLKRLPLTEKARPATSTTRPKAVAVATTGDAQHRLEPHSSSSQVLSPDGESRAQRTAPGLP
jgi:hypothetical protein